MAASRPVKKVSASTRTKHQQEHMRITEVQTALIGISSAALTAESLDELYRIIHQSIKNLMPAENFYICLFDAATDMIWFPYFVDEFDSNSPPQKLDKGLTAWVIRNGKPILALPDVFNTLVANGEVELVGAPSIDWLGVPLVIAGKVIGALAVQSYSEAVRYTQKDLEILQFVSTQVAMAIDRRRADEALVEESQFRKAIEDSILAGIIAADSQNRQSYVNPAFCRMVGWSQEELLGATPPFVYWPPEFTDAIMDAFRVTTGDEALPSDFELVFRRRNGERFDAYLLVSPLRNGQGNAHGWLASVYDITARKRDEEIIRRQKSRAEALARTAARLNTRLDLKKVMEMVCEETTRALNVSATSLFIYNRKTDSYHLGAGYGWPEGYYQSFQPIPRRLVEQKNGKGQSRVVYRDIRSHKEFPNQALYQDLNVRTIAITGLSRDQSLIGSLGVFCFEIERDFSKDELALLDGLADLAAQAILNARLFDELEQSLQQVRALNAVDVAINASLDLRVTLNILLDQVVNILHVDAADIWLYNVITQELEFTVGRGFRVVQPLVGSMRLGENYASKVVIERKMLHIQDLADVPNGYASVNRSANDGLHAYIGIPLVAKGQVKGVLEIFQRTEIDLNSDWMELLDALSGQAAIAIDNATLFNQLQRSNEELMHALDSMLEGWDRFANAHNHTSDGHIDRLIEFTMRLARNSGIREEELVHIRRGVLLHDIGMLRVPESIISKPGPLTPEEMEIVKQHPNFAYQLISSIAILRPCVDIPYCHHERWDGQGYPRRLKNTQIPLVARIFSVVDVWEVLRSARPYRDAWQEQKARQYFEKQAGIEFDPAIVQQFFDIL